MRCRRSPARGGRTAAPAPTARRRSGAVHRSTPAARSIRAAREPCSCRAPRLLDTLEPDLPPERVDRPRAVGGVCTFADDAVEHDAGVLHLQHATGCLFDASVDPAEDARLSPAKPRHLLLETESSVAAVLAQGAHDLRLGLDAHELAWLQVRVPRRRLCERALDEAPAQAATKPDPTGKDPGAGALEAIEQPREEGADHGERADIARSDIPGVLTELAER